MRLDSTGRVADTHYSIVSEGEAQWARAYDPGGDGDLYAGRSGGGFWGPPGGYYEQGNGFVPPGSVYGPPRRAGLFGEIFGGGDQRYYEQQEMARQRQRRVDPDYFMNRWQTN
jgi:hypothetical protein